MTTTTTTSFRLRAITDESITKTHLGAVEKAGRTWCGVDLLVKDDPRFGGRYKGIVFTATPTWTPSTAGRASGQPPWKGQRRQVHVPLESAARDRDRETARRDYKRHTG